MSYLIPPIVIETGIFPIHIRSIEKIIIKEAVNRISVAKMHIRRNEMC